MRRMMTCAAAVAVLWVGDHGAAAQRAPTAAAPPLIDYTTDGGDPQRTGWIRDEKILTKDNVGGLKVQWKRETGNEPRALHALMPVLVASHPGPGAAATPRAGTPPQPSGSRRPCQAARDRRRRLRQHGRVRRRHWKDRVAPRVG